MRNASIGHGNHPSSHFHDEKESERHALEIKLLAQEIGWPIQEVEELYEEIHEHLRARARILDYLPILVSKRVKEIYRNQCRHRQSHLPQ